MDRAVRMYQDTAQLRAQGADHLHRSSLLLLGVPARARLARRLLSRHGSILVSEARSLHGTQGDWTSVAGSEVRSCSPVGGSRVAQPGDAKPDQHVVHPGRGDASAVLAAQFVGDAVRGRACCRGAAARSGPAAAVGCAAASGAGARSGAVSRELVPRLEVLPTSDHPSWRVRSRRVTNLRRRDISRSRSQRCRADKEGGSCTGATR